MQSYCNFSVGGSVSVNCHGRGLLYGTVGDSVESMTVLTTQGHLFVIDRSHYPDLFAAVIGGYGGIAIIIDVTLIVTDNFPIERKVTTIPINQLDQFYATLKRNKDLVFYNSNIYPKNETEIVNICWYKAKSSQALTCKDRLQTKQDIYLGHMIVEQILRRNNASKYLRAQLEPSILTTKAIVYKNYEMSYDVEALEPLMKFPTTNILQEYFVPVKSIRPFLASFRNIIDDYGVNLLNISLRYVMATNLSILNYTPTDRIAVVLYLNIGNNSYCVNYAKQWTQLIINTVIKLGGSYYLPYLPLATLQQFRLAYPNYHLYMKIKEKYDPQNRLSNQFIDQYLRH
jgi:FAD/FMN-containing dehydrogenase